MTSEKGLPGNYPKTMGTWSVHTAESYAAMKRGPALAPTPAWSAGRGGLERDACSYSGEGLAWPSRATGANTGPP